MRQAPCACEAYVLRKELKGKGVVASVPAGLTACNEGLHHIAPFTMFTNIGSCIIFIVFDVVCEGHGMENNEFFKLGSPQWMWVLCDARREKEFGFQDFWLIVTVQHGSLKACHTSSTFLFVFSFVTMTTSPYLTSTCLQNAQFKTKPLDRRLGEPSAGVELSQT